MILGVVCKSLFCDCSSRVKKFFYNPVRDIDTYINIFYMWLNSHAIGFSRRINGIHGYLIEIYDQCFEKNQIGNFLKTLIIFSKHWLLKNDE